jgi:hypothetical protein
MKSIFLTAAFAIFSTAVFASGNLKVNMAQAEAQKAVIEANNVTEELFEIGVRDVFGDLIFSKTTEADFDYKKKYDFSELVDGIYTLEVKHGEEKYLKQFRLDRGEFDVISERRIVKPHMDFSDNAFTLSFLNYNEERMGLYVYEGSKLLYEKKIAPVFTVNEGLDFSGLGSGDYKIVFATEFSVYEHEVTIE